MDCWLKWTKTKTEVVNIGLLILLKLLGAKKEMCLDEWRSRKYIDMITRSSKNAVKPESLGPTKDAAELHLLRCYYQIQVWMGNACIEPLSWGWKKSKGKMMPLEMSKPIALPQLLKVIRCNFKTDCSRRQCTRKQYGINCTKMCGECRGVSCLNQEQYGQDEC